MTTRFRARAEEAIAWGWRWTIGFLALLGIAETVFWIAKFLLG
jgi:hypothetical protein